jgi:hypothetical protein
MTSQDDGVRRPDWALPGELRGISVKPEAYANVATSSNSWPTGWPQSWRQPGKVWRADVFDVATAWRLGSMPSRQLLVAVCAWGHGDNGYGPWRTAKTLGARDLDLRLNVLDPLRVENVPIDRLIEAYEAFRDPRTSRLPWFRAPFFTKLLYFAGYRRGHSSIQPLILDSVVARRLPDDVGVRKPIGRNAPQWTSIEWMSYISWARAQKPKEPDEVELRLFSG